MVLSRRHIVSTVVFCSLVCCGVWLSSKEAPQPQLTKLNNQDSLDNGLEPASIPATRHDHVVDPQQHERAQEVSTSIPSEKIDAADIAAPAVVSRAPSIVYKYHPTDATYNASIPPLQYLSDGGESFIPKVHEYGWVFKRYVPSKLEVDFYEAAGEVEREKDWVTPLLPKFQAQFEKLVRDMEARVIPNAPLTDFEKYRSECRSYVADTVAGRPVSNETCLSSTEPMDDAIFSRFEYQFECIDQPCRGAPPAFPAVGEKHVSYIEPLGGLMRHPKVFLLNSSRPFLLNKAYMIADKWALHNLHLRYRTEVKHSHYLDCGASTYATGLGGASQNWFVGLGDCMCTPFDTMRLWEMKQHQADTFWSGVPKRLHPNYMWFNYPLSADVDSFSNPFNHLISKVAFGDPVIMKIDFDTPVLELKLIQTMLRTPDVYRRIDELFFEHHVNIPLLSRVWSSYDKKCFIRCSMDLFTSMRKLGIRAHSWV